MVSDDHRHLQRPGISDLLLRRNTIIASEDRIDILLPRFFDQILIDSVAILDAMRNIVIHLRAKALQSAIQNKSGTHTIHVVITDNTDRLFLKQLIQQDVCRLLHIFHTVRLMAILKFTLKKQADGLIALHIPVAQYAGGNGTDAKLLGNAVKIRLFCIHHPLFLHRLSTSSLLKIRYPGPDKI